MNRIVIVVVVALVALLIIQAFQTLQLYDRKHTEFEANLTTSLERIAIRHEKAEDMRRYLKIVNRDFSGQYKDILKQEFQHLVSSQESISIHDTSMMENGEMHNYLIIKGKAYDSLTGLTTEQRVLARDVRELRDLFDKHKKQLPINDSVKLAIQLDQRVMQQIFKKAKFVNEIMIEAFRNNVYEDPAHRIDVFYLDSVIKTELANDNLPHTYKFMVCNEIGVPIKFPKQTSNYDTKLDTLVTGKTELFPSNILDENVYLHIYFPKKGGFLLKEMWGSLIISLTLMCLIIVALMFMFKTILAQEKISEMKNDFISNMTHEFKTPISTISLACEAMNDQDVIKEGSAQFAPFIKMINEENQRLGILVERILQSAVLDRGEVKLKKERFPITEIIRDIADSARFRIQQTGGKIELELPNDKFEIEADRMHFTHILSNLVDNAIKYSKEIPEIKISLRQENKRWLLCVSDKGIGIKREHLNKVFEKLYRVPTGNLHNVKGFGLGLSYVKAICDLHGWDIKVRSRFGEGSEFTIFIK